MNTIQLKTYSLLSALLLLLLTQSVLAKKMYRWTDASGNTMYSDKIPPDQVEYRRESLNNQIRVVDVTEKKKTKSQRELENRLMLLQRQQKEIVEKQKARDKLLLSAYRNVHDMKKALNSKILAMDGRRKVVQNNGIRLEAQLQNYRKKAAQYDRDGKKVPQDLLVEISEIQRQINRIDTDIANKLVVKDSELSKMEVDIKRYQSLTQSGTESKMMSRKSAEKIASNELGLYICESVRQCNKAWLIAKKFVSIYSSTGIEIDSEGLIMSLAPRADTDLSLSVSKMNINNTQQLFLDIRCRQSSLGEETCNSQKVQILRRSFYDYIISAL